MSISDGGGGGTRQRLLALLCTGDWTTSELAKELGISAAGVRAQLERLEEEELVERRVVRRGVGKPGYEYRLSEAGSQRLSRAYLPLLVELLTVVEARLGQEAALEVLQESGRRLGRAAGPAAGTLRERVVRASEFLEDLGGACTLVEKDGSILLEGTCCPVRALVKEHPEACRAVEGLVEEIVGVDVREQCEKGNVPLCRLVVPLGLQAR